MKLIESKTLATAAASIEFTSIPQTYTDLVVVYSLRDTGTNGTERVHQTALSLNGATSSFSSRVLAGNGSSAFSFSDTPRFSGWHPDAAATSNTFGNTALYLPNYTGSTNKSYSIDQVAENNATKTYASIIAGLRSDTAAITSLALTTLGTNLAVGSTASLYGILKGSDGIVTTS
jgi:hypothetical protein